MVYVHGFTERAMGLGARTMREGESEKKKKTETDLKTLISAYLRKGHYNVIVVDWGSLAAFPYYAAAVKNTKTVGRYVAEFLVFLNDERIVPLQKIHLIGFSLGAEVAGFTGKHLGPEALTRITGRSNRFRVESFGEKITTQALFQGWIRLSPFTFFKAKKDIFPERTPNSWT